MNEKIKVGIIGCGAISEAYFKGCKRFPILDVVACADLDMARAQARAGQFGVPRALEVDQLLSDPEVQIVVNLTIPKAHAEVSMAAFAAGKHVWSEKPFAITRAEGKTVLESAAKNRVLIGSASDTFLGEAHQTCRKLIDEGAIGEPLAAVACMASRGVENWHPNPSFYYDIGGGPMFDMGPYYFAALVNMIGPMRRVCGSTKMGFRERAVASQPLAGAKITVKTPTHLTGAVDFHNGATATVLMSFDTTAHNLPMLEIYGTEGSLVAPDPNQTKGAPLLRRQEKEWQPASLTHTPVYTENYGRGVGVADMARAILTGRPHRASGELAYHIVDAMTAFEESSVSGRHVELESTCAQPAPLPTGLAPGELD